MRDSTWGFQLRELRVCGVGVDPGSLLFVAGLNVVEGPSDTGKSFAVSCIDFVLGASNKPEDIPEAQGYEYAYLQIESSDGIHYSLKRALAGGKIHLFRGKIDDALSSERDEWQVLSARASAQRSVSEFLLGLSGLTEKLVRKNTRGETTPASFRTLAKSLIVDEQRIIAKQSPIYGTQKTQNTAAANTIRVLLTGQDDSTIEKQPDRKIAVGRLAGKKEAFETIISREKIALAELLRDNERVEDSLIALDHLDEFIIKLSENVATASAELRAAEDRRRIAWTKLRKHRERLAELDGLLKRAALLDEHYASDLRRLDAVAESAHLLLHYAEESCQLCGADPKFQQHEHGQPPDLVSEAAAVEAHKIRRLRRELEKANEQISKEREEISLTVLTVTGIVEQHSNQIDQELAPRVRDAANILRSFQEEYERHIRVQEAAARLSSSRQEMNRLPSAVEKPAKQEFATLSSETMAGVCESVAQLLTRWEMFERPLVTFDEKTADLLIEGRSRISHGKGVRAVMCAAYVIGLMLHCLTERHGHPGFVVVDTPLNPYKQRQADDDGQVEASVKEEFYRDLCQQIGQVVVFENVPPPADVQHACHYVSFSGPNRHGFLPG